MNTTPKKSSSNFKKAAISAFIFLAIFVVFVYLVNFDTQAFFKKKEIKFASFAGAIDIDDPNISDSDRDGLSDDFEYAYGTDASKKDTDGDGYEDLKEISNGYDPDAPGDARYKVEISIDKIGISAPVIWSDSVDEKKQLEDLQKGLSHYPESAAPGQSGNMIVSGHSSNYVWSKGSYNYIFRKLNELEIGDFVEVKISLENGRTINYSYKVREKFIVAPDDEKIFADSKNPVLSLSTCWPLGTNFRRLVVRTELESFE